MTQPMAFCWDHRGRMWIAENRDYENRRSGFSNSGDSRILILEDTDRDGVADSRKVFLEGILYGHLFDSAPIPDICLPIFETTSKPLTSLPTAA